MYPPNKTVAILSLALGIALQSPGQSFWQGESDGYQIEWSAANLTAKKTSARDAVSFDGVKLAKAKWKEITSDRSAHNGSVNDYSAEFDYRLLSVVGNVISVEKGEECDCGGAHPSEVTEFMAYDLAKGTAAKPVLASLRDYFPAGTLYAALMKDQVVKKILVSKKPASLDELIDALAMEHYASGDCDYAFDAHFLSNFAFYDYRSGTVDVRISLSHAVETCRGQFVQVGLELPVANDSLKAKLAQAKASQKGILMKALRQKVGQEPVTSLSFPETK